MGMINKQSALVIQWLMKEYVELCDDMRGKTIKTHSLYEVKTRIEQIIKMVHCQLGLGDIQEVIVIDKNQMSMVDVDKLLRRSYEDGNCYVMFDSLFGFMDINIDGLVKKITTGSYVYDRFIK